jgi:uncharacterized protein (DUF1778 family)
MTDTMTVRVTIDLSPDAAERIKRAADAARTPLEEFIAAAASDAADERGLAISPRTELTAEQWERFVAELDRPPAPPLGMERLAGPPRNW